MTTERDTSTATPLIELRNLAVGYGKRRLVEDANVQLLAGQLVALLGRNGSGKSTLLRAMAGLAPRLEGSVVYSGNPTIVDKPQRATTLAFVNTSRLRVPNMRCRDVVALGRAPYTNWAGRQRSSDEEAVMKALQTVDMEQFADRQISTLSDGESQRVMIARAIAQDTPVILLDEPTSFLDIPNRHSLMQLLANLAHTQGKCVVLSTHELDLALQHCDHIALIDNRRLSLLPTSAPATASLLATAFNLPSNPLN